MGSIVTHVDQGWVLVRDHAGEQTRYDANTVLWTAGVEAPPVAAALAAATGAQCDRTGRIMVEKNLTIPGHPEISVLGDMMSLDKLPGVAEVAMQSGLYAGHRVRRRAAGMWPRSRSATVTSARRPTSPAAVPSVSAGPLQFGGFPGWGIWLFIHIAFLTGYRNRVGAAAHLVAGLHPRRSAASGPSPPSNSSRGTSTRSRWAASAPEPVAAPEPAAGKPTATSG